MKQGFAPKLRPAVILLAALALISSLSAKEVSSVPNAAPGFVGGTSQGRSVSLSSLKGKPVVLLIAPSARDSRFNSQFRELRGRYERLAAQGVVFFASLVADESVIRSNIPFLLVKDPSSVAAAYDVGRGFAIAVIGRDGNLDCLSTKPLPGQRVLDLVNNNASVQEKMRR